MMTDNNEGFREFAVCLKDGLSQRGLPLAPGVADDFWRHFQMVRKGNSRFNLTSIVSPRDAAVKHYLDSLLCLQDMDLPAASKVLDLGSGAGFPGIPLKIWRPDLKLTLLDSNRKKASFLEEVAREFNFKDVDVLWGRAEDLAHLNHIRNGYYLVVSRAVAPLAVLAEYGLPFCALNGYLVCLKGPNGVSEAEAALRAIHLLGGKLETVREYELPFLAHRRTAVIARKLKVTPDLYPRRAGMPAKKPL